MQSADRYRTIPSVAGRLGRHITIGEERLLNLSSNDYLGLGDDPVLRSAWLEAAGADLPPMSSSSSRLLTGNHPLAEALEAELSALYGGRAAMLFNSGYHANTGILPALAGRHDLVLSDRLNHASIIDGLKISDANWKRYRHLDCDHLEEMLQEARGKRRQCFIVSESIFSMDGDLVDLKRLVELKKRYGAILILDEAHAVGTLGQEGLGLAEQEGLGGEVDIIVGTFGKAFASTGAYAIIGPPPAGVSGQYRKTIHFYYGHSSGDAFLESLDSSPSDRDAVGEGVAAGACLEASHLVAAAGVHCSG